MKREEKQIAMLFGHPRSGTNVTVHAIKKSPEVTLFNENHPAAFRKSNLISLDILPKAARTADARVALFKPIAATRDIMKLGNLYPDAKYMLAFRHYSSVHLSYVKAFKERGERALRNRLEKKIFESTIAVFRDIDPEFDPGNMSFDENFILSWCHDTRLMLAFSEKFPHVSLATVYESLLADPANSIGKICDLLEIAYLPKMIEGISQKTFATPTISVRGRLRDYAEDLYRHATRIAK